MAKKDLKNDIRDFMKRYRYSKLITMVPDGTPHGRMMTHLPPGDDMVIWYATGRQSNKVREIKKNPNVSVFIDHPTDHMSVSILGKAEIVTDTRRRKKYWQDAWSFFWPDGPNDPDYCLIKITPNKIEYLDPGPSYHADQTRLVLKL